MFARKRKLALLNLYMRSERKYRFSHRNRKSELIGSLQFYKRFCSKTSDLSLGIDNGRKIGSPPNLVQDELGRVLNGLQESVALCCPKRTERSPFAQRVWCG